MLRFPEWDPREEQTRLDGPFGVGTTGYSKQRGNPGGPFTITALERTDVADVPRLVGSATPQDCPGHQTFDPGRPGATFGGRGCLMTVEAPGPLASPGFWLHHAALTYRRIMESRLDGIGITYSQFNLLSAVSWLSSQNGRPPTQQQAADFARSDRMMTSKLVHTLLGQGYLRRTPDPSDARVWRLQLSARGRAAVRAGVAAAHAVDEQLLGSAPALRTALRAIAERDWSAASAPSPPAVVRARTRGA